MFAPSSAQLAKQSPILSYPKVVYSFWTGNNEITEARRRNIERNTNHLRHLGITFCLVTPRNLGDFVRMTGVPLHEGYKYLSAVHKSDYLRCYFMHFVGGGYSDIKAMQGNWNRAFNDLVFSDGKYANVASPTMTNPRTQDSQQQQFIVTSMVCKKDTPLTRDWYKSVINVMDASLGTLKEYPSVDTHQEPTPNYPYPIKWTDICGSIFSPLCLKYKEHILQTTPTHAPSSIYR
jgi:hypothetical protein